jgi:hypothetical protein
MNQEILNKFAQIESDIRLTINPYSEGLHLQPDKFFMTNFYYPTLNIVDKIKVDDFEMYCIDAVTEEKIIYPSQDYTLLSVKDKILVVFHNYRKFTARTYLYAEYNGAKSLIQVSLFEDMQRFFHMGKDHTWGGFAFTGSRIVQKSDIVATKERCDLNDYGPIYWDNTGNMSTNPQNNSFSQTLSIVNLADFSIVASVPGAGHILYLRFKPINGKFVAAEGANEAVVPAGARTLFEIIKLIDEWASVSQSPWNNTQDISVKAKDFMDGLSMSQNVIDLIRSEQTDMQVYRYLAGSENARQRPPLEEVALMPQSVYDWFKQQFCYRSFENLILYHPIFNEETQ